MAATFSKARWEILQKLSGEEKVRLSCELTNLCFQMTRDGIRAQFPGITPEGVERELWRRLGYPVELLKERQKVARKRAG